jgi:hypothetical protein
MMARPFRFEDVYISGDLRLQLLLDEAFDAVDGGSTAVEWADIQGVPTAFTPTAHNQAWSTITDTPTTLAGYGITDGGSGGASISGSFVTDDGVYVIGGPVGASQFAVDDGVYVP